MFLKYFIVFILSMFPLIELRAAIPIGVLSFSLNFYIVVILSILSNILVIPVIFLFLDYILKYLDKIKLWRSFWQYITKRTRNKFVKKYSKLGYLGLFIFVAIPLPGTGVWSGSLVAYLFDFDRKKTFLILSLAVICAGIAITVLTAFTEYTILPT